MIRTQKIRLIFCCFGMLIFFSVINIPVYTTRSLCSALFMESSFLIIQEKEDDFDIILNVEIGGKKKNFFLFIKR